MGPAEKKFILTVGLAGVNAVGQGARFWEKPESHEIVTGGTPEGRQALRVAADGTRALMCANATPYEQKITYRWKGAWPRSTLQPRELRLVPIAK